MFQEDDPRFPREVIDKDKEDADSGWVGQEGTHFIIGIEDILNHEPHDHNVFGDNPVGWPLCGEGQVDRVGGMSLCSNKSLPMESFHNGNGSTYHNSYIMRC